MWITVQKSTRLHFLLPVIPGGRSTCRRLMEARNLPMCNPVETFVALPYEGPVIENPVSSWSPSELLRMFMGLLNQPFEVLHFGLIQSPVTWFIASCTAFSLSPYLTSFNFGSRLTSQPNWKFLLLSPNLLGYVKLQLDQTVTPTTIAIPLFIIVLMSFHCWPRHWVQVWR